MQAFLSFNTISTIRLRWTKSKKKRQTNYFIRQTTQNKKTSLKSLIRLFNT